MTRIHPTCHSQPNTLGLRQNGSSGSWHDNGTQGRSVSLPEPGAAYPFKSTTTSCPRVSVSGPHSNIPPSWRHPAMCLPWRSRVPSKARIDDSISPGSPWASAHHHTTTHGVWTRHELHRGPPRNNKHVGHMHAVPRGTTLTAGSTPSPQHPRDGPHPPTDAKHNHRRRNESSPT